MLNVAAVHSFTHNGVSYKRGQTWEEESDRLAAELQRRGLIKVLEPVIADPQKVTGAKLSASPADPALPRQTSKQSGNGGRRKKGAASSSPTPRSA